MVRGEELALGRQGLRFELGPTGFKPYQYFSYQLRLETRGVRSVITRVSAPVAAEIRPGIRPRASGIDVLARELG